MAGNVPIDLKQSINDLFGRHDHRNGSARRTDNLGGIEDDLRLLRAYEPVARFTEGEYFFPVSAERYVGRASLWRARPGTGLEQVVPPGGLTLETLATEQGLHYSLSGIGAGNRHAHIPLRERPPHLRRSSRLASVGPTARLVDAMNRFSLLFRGSVPGGSAAQSFLLQRDHLRPGQPTYYGRVLRDDPWIVCQYWFFYSFNNWRSAFGGVNEHEADWEQVTVYLDGTGATGPDGLPPPRWVVFSAHEETGDDLRRRWDDPDLTVYGGRHPVVFVGAGSHSGAYLPGDYLITVKPPKLRGLVGALRWSARLFAPWHEGQPSVGIPYVDYARGDGRAVGPGHDEPWHPVLIGDDTPWVRDFRGLWGRDTRDRLGGERGPAGPRYSRDGTVRQSWADPVGWAGLAKVAPNPDAERKLAEVRLQRDHDRLTTLDEQIATLRQDLAVAAAGLPAASPEVRGLLADERRLLGLRMERTRLADELARAAGAAPLTDHPHAHLLHRRVPLEPATGLRGRIMSWWAVLSTPLILSALGAVALPFGTWGNDIALALLLGLLAVEGLVRGKFLAVLLRLLVAAAAIGALLLLWYDGRYVVTFTFFAAAILVLLVNMREAMRR